MSGHTGHKNATYRLPTNHQNTKADVTVLSFTTAPREVQDISANGAIRGPSYHYKHNPVTSNITSKYNEDQLDPLPSNFNVTLNTYSAPGNSTFASRPDLAPYYLFLENLASQSVSNLQPKFTLDIWMKSDKLTINSLQIFIIYQIIPKIIHFMRLIYQETIQ